MSLFRNLLIEKALELPSIYRKADSLQSDGQAYINTGFVMPEEGATIETDFIFTTHETVSSVIWGSRTQASSYCGMLFYRYGGNHVSAFVADKAIVAQASAVALPVGVTHQHKVLFYKNSAGNYCGQEYVNGVQSVELQNPTSYVQENRPIFLFALNDRGNPSFLTPTCIKSFKVFSVDGAKIMDLIPCVRKADNVPGFFDKIGRKFLTNAASSGSFIIE